MLVSVIILNYNGARTINECVKSVLNSSLKDLEVIVVDNASFDKSLNLIKKYKVKVIRNKKNYGYAEGNNIGIRKARGKYIFLLNNDAYVDKNCLRNLLKNVKEDTGAAGCKIYYYKSRKMWFSGGHEYIAGIVNNHYLNNKRGYCDYVSGCAMLLRKSILNKVGLLNKKYFTYFEETELCRRIRKAGYKILYEPRAIVYHDIKKDRLSSNEVYHMFRNRVWYTLGNKKYKLFWKILDFFLFYPLFTLYQVYKNKKVLYYTKEILRARIDSLK